MLELILSALLAFLQAHVAIPDVPPSSPATTTATVVRVIDGDTIDVRLDGAVERVRYIGIDTPEPYAGTAPECYATEATAFNEALVAGETVSLVADEENRDDYNRLLRYVYVNEELVNAVLVRNGFATTLPIEPNTRFARHFHTLEQSAEAKHVGLWGQCR